MDGELRESAGDFIQRVGIDGKLWAEEMHKRFPQVPEDDLLGWCCNMIMAGYDHARGVPINGDHTQFLLDKAASLPSAQPSDVVVRGGLDELLDVLLLSFNDFMDKYPDWLRCGNRSSISEELARGIRRKRKAALTTQQAQSGDVQKLVEAANQVLWKLRHGGNDNPNTVTRLDATIRMLESAIEPFNDRK